MKNITQLALLVVLTVLAPAGFAQSVPVHPINFSTRLVIGDLAEGSEAIAGFVVKAGPNYKSGDAMTVLIRVVGPGLDQFFGPDGANVTDRDPMVQVYNQANTSTPIAQNNGWDGAQRRLPQWHPSEHSLSPSEVWTRL